jgi:hypothetical protein
MPSLYGASRAVLPVVSRISKSPVINIASGTFSAIGTSTIKLRDRWLRLSSRVARSSWFRHMFFPVIRKAARSRRIHRPPNSLVPLLRCLADYRDGLVDFEYEPKPVRT